MKSYHQFISETKVYRGGDNSSSVLTWYSLDKKQAQGYADSRDNGSVITKNINTNGLLNLVRDVYTSTPSEVVGMAISQLSTTPTGANKKRMLDARKDFIKYFGTSELEMTEFWSNDNKKKEFVKLLKAFGYSGVTITEDGINTYGML